MEARDIASSARRCALSGKAFAQGDCVRSYLLDAGREYERVDMLAAECAAYVAPKPVVCRWDWQVKPRDNRAKEALRDALEQNEAMFCALCDGGEAAPSGEENAILRHLLCLALQRKRVLRPVDGQRGQYLHTASGRVFLCPEPQTLPADLLRKASALIQPV